MSNDSNRSPEVLAALRSLADVVPEMRTGQLIGAVGELCMDLHGRGLWDASDTEFLEAVRQFQRNLESATATAVMSKRDS